MSGGQMIPVLIVAIVMFALVMKSRYRYLSKQQGIMSPDDQVENFRLREEVRALKDRIHTLERIAVDKENSLSREIEELRDR